MLLIFVFVFAICLHGCQYFKRGFNSEYLSIESTNAIKGVFILLVFVQHIIPYILESGYQFSEGASKEIFYFIKNHINQWIVAMFLFYSGYGIMEAIKNKGDNYLMRMPKYRIFKVWINFVVAVFCYIILAYILGNSLTINKCLLSLVGWESVGNSNWYIFVILVLYIITYLCAINRGSLKALYLILLVSVVFAVSLTFFKPSYWYNTILCYIAGMFYSYYIHVIEEKLIKKYYVILGALLIVMLCLDRIPYIMHGILYNVFAVIFCLCVIMLSMKIRLNNAFLIWCGRNLFPIYIYQRVPMIVLSSICGGCFAQRTPVLFTLSCFVITVLMVLGYKKIELSFRT